MFRWFEDLSPKQKMFAAIIGVLGGVGLLLLAKRSTGTAGTATTPAVNTSTNPQIDPTTGVAYDPTTGLPYGSPGGSQGPIDVIIQPSNPSAGQTTIPQPANGGSGVGGTAPTASASDPGGTASNPVIPPFNNTIHPIAAPPGTAQAPPSAVGPTGTDQTSIMPATQPGQTYAEVNGRLVLTGGQSSISPAPYDTGFPVGSYTGPPPPPMGIPPQSIYTGGQIGNPFAAPSTSVNIPPSGPGAAEAAAVNHANPLGFATLTPSMPTLPVAIRNAGGIPSSGGLLAALNHTVNPVSAVVYNPAPRPGRPTAF